jgi:predicted nucleic acid-binding protein
MSVERATYLDSSALVKLVIAEPESAALRAYLRRRRLLVSSGLARAEVHRAVLHVGPKAVKRALEVLGRVDLIRIGTPILEAAGGMEPHELRSLDALHLATALQLGEDLARFVVYDERLSEAARTAGLPVISPT